MDSVITTYVLDPRGFVAGSAAVASATRSTITAIGMAKGAVSSLGGVLSKAFNPLAAAIGGVGLIAFAKSAVEANAEVDSLTMGLTAVMGSAKAAQAELVRLREVAKAPGVGYAEAIQMSVALQSAGLSADQAAKSIFVFGNALATVGKGKAELALVQLALSQIASSSKVLGQDVRQLQTQMPQMLAAMRAAFGTTDTTKIEDMGIDPKEFVKRITDELAKLPQKTGGVRNAFDNLSDGVMLMMNSVGAAINAKLIPIIDDIQVAINNILTSGVLDEIAAGIVGIFGDPGDGLKSAIAWVLAGLKEGPKYINQLKSSFVDAFNYMREQGQALAAVLGAIFLGGSVIQGIASVVMAVRALITVIQSAGIAAAIMQGILSGAAGVAKVILGALAGAAAGVLIYKGLDAMFGSAEDMLANATAGMPSLDSMKKSHDEILKIMNQPQAPGANPAANGGDTTNSALGAIERNTRKTAENTKPFTERTGIVGGGDIARMGIPISERSKRHTGRSKEADQIADLIDAMVKRLSMQTLNVLDYPSYGSR